MGKTIGVPFLCARSNDAENIDDLKRLTESFKWSQRKLQPHRDTRAKFMRAYLGNMYSEVDSDTSVAVNLIEQLVNVYMRS